MSWMGKRKSTYRFQECSSVHIAVINLMCVHILFHDLQQDNEVCFESDHASLTCIASCAIIILLGPCRDGFVLDGDSFSCCNSL